MVKVPRDAVKDPVVRVPMVAALAKRFVVLAVPETKSDEVVAFVEVLLSAVKFWKVLEPLARILRAESVPARVSLPPLLVVKKKLEVEALVAKKFVVVAEVPVALMKVKF